MKSVSNPQITLERLGWSDSSVDRIISRVDLSVRRAMFFVYRPTGWLSLVTAEVDGSQITRIVGVTNFPRDRFEELDHAFAGAKRALEALT